MLQQGGVFAEGTRGASRRLEQRTFHALKEGSVDARARASQRQGAKQHASRPEYRRRDACRVGVAVTDGEAIAGPADGLVGFARLAGKRGKHASAGADQQRQYVALAYRVADRMLGFDTIKAGADVTRTNIEGNTLPTVLGEVAHDRQQDINRHDRALIERAEPKGGRPDPVASIVQALKQLPAQQRIRQPQDRALVEAGTHRDFGQAERAFVGGEGIEDGVIRLRGYEIQHLIGRVSFPAMIWLMLRGELPSEDQAALLGIALGAAVDHGPQAPSIAIARMAATCGVGINSAMASAINVLGDVHGGAGEQALSLYGDIAVVIDGGAALNEAVSARLDRFFAEEKCYVPGLGHRFHPVDPRAPRLLELTREFAARSIVNGRFADIAEAIEADVARRKGKKIPLNIDGATAVIYGELGFPPPLTRGLFVLSRSVGILAHAWEQSQQSERNKGPLPREWLWAYTGTPARPFPEDGGTSG